MSGVVGRGVLGCHAGTPPETYQLVNIDFLNYIAQQRKLAIHMRIA